MTLQSLQFRLCLDQFRLGQHFRRSQEARRCPIGWLLCSNEFASCGGMS